MKHSLYPSLSALVLALGTLTLVGCGGASSFSNPGSAGTPPPTGTPPAHSVAGPAISGFSYGGHSPIGNQHVYLLQPGTTGYGSAATSLLGNNGVNVDGNGVALNANVNDPNVPTTTTAKYVITGSDGSFNLTGAYSCVVGQPVYIYAWSGNIGGGAINNNNIVQLATLGNCPSNGSFSGSSALSFVYMNEVSTVATAYTFQPFTVVGNNNAWDIGTSNTTEGLIGIANAANTAAQLYNIAGGTQISSTQDGEGHIANYQTQLTGVPNDGNGVVPQATIDSLANIVAACVDSTVATLGTPAAQCSSLFTVATDNGETTGTQPVDTATAMINVARFPAGNNSGTAVDATYAKDIFAIPTGTVPYAPALSHAPNDWTIAINYPGPNNGVAGSASSGTVTNSTLNSAESIAVDDIGQVWITSQGEENAGGTAFINKPDIVRWSSLGAQNSINTYTYIPGYVSIDGSNNAWTGNANDAPAAAPYSGNGGTGTSIFFAGSNGVFSTDYGSGYYKAYTVVADKAGDAFFFAGNATLGGNYDMWEYNPSGTLIGGSPIGISGTSTTPVITPVTQNLNITKASETNTGGNYTYTFAFTYAGGTPPTVLAVGDTVPLTLTNDAGTNPGRTAATGWQNLTSVTVASVNDTANPTSFTATGTTVTTNSNDANGAATTAAIDITAATETNATRFGVTTYTYTFDFTNVGGTPGTPLAVGDTVPLALTNDPGTGTTPVPATGWQNLHSVTVASVNSTTNPTSFTATSTTTATTNTDSSNTNGLPETATINITAATVVNNGGGHYTYTFTYNTVGTPTPLAVGDTVNTSNLANDAGRNPGRTAATGWTNLNSVVVATVNGAGTSFTATGTTAATDSNDGNGATGTGTYPYFINGATGTGTFQYTNANGATGTGSYVYDTTTEVTGPSAGDALEAGDNVGHGAIDSAGHLWITAETPGNTIARINSAGVPDFASIITAEQPEFPAIDASNNAWIAIQQTAAQVDVVSPTGNVTVLTPTGTGGTTATGALMTSTFGAAVDGNGNVWFANRAGNYGAISGVTGTNSIFVLNGGVSTPGTIYNAISPPTNYVPEAQYGGTTTPTPILNGSLNLAIDPSGNVWITDYTGGGVVELVGAAAPVVTPLSLAAGNGQLGQKP